MCCWQLALGGDAVGGGGADMMFGGFDWKDIASGQVMIAVVVVDDQVVDGVVVVIDWVAMTAGNCMEVVCM